MYQNRFMYFFIFFEWILFTLPILPSSLYVRLAISVLYYISHLLKVNIYYARFKYYMLNNKNRHDDTIDYASLVENIVPSISSSISPSISSSIPPSISKENIIESEHNE